MEVGCCRFLNSPPLNVLLTLALVTAAERFAGLDSWLREARARLPAGLLQEITLLAGFPGGSLRFVEAVAAHTVGTEEQARAPFAAWAATLEALPPAAFQSMALHALRRGISAETVTDQDLRDPQYLRALLVARDPERDPAPALAFVLDPAGLRDRFLVALARFWEQLYQAVYEASRPLLERSAAYHQAQDHPGDLAAVFAAVTGRDLPAEVQFYLPEFRRVWFVPSYYLGKRVAFFRVGERLTVFYSVADK